jgi:hypothetical protein
MPEFPSPQRTRVAMDASIVSKLAKEFKEKFAKSVI